MKHYFLLFLAACLVLGLSGNATAYEHYVRTGYPEARLGDPLNRWGTRRSDASAAVSLRMNLIRVDDYDGNTQAEAASELSSADISRFSSLINRAAGFWNNVPSSWVSTQLSGTERTSTFIRIRSYLLLTLVRTNRWAGVSYNAVWSGQLSPAGIGINYDYFRRYSDAQVLQTIVHEIGHSLGLAHSTLDRNLTRNSRFDNTDSLGAFMSYSRSSAQSMLHADEVAGISNLYGNASASTTLGSVSGELVDASGQAIFGGNVFAVNSDNMAQVARLSGHTDFVSLSSRHGKFSLTGLRPGTYTIVAAPVDDPTYRIGRLPRLPNHNYLTRGFSAAIRGEVVVRAGQVVDLGRLVSGQQTGEKPSSGTRVSWPAFPGATSYSVLLWSRTLRKVVRVKSTKTFLRHALADGSYMLYVRSNNGGLVEYRRLTVTDGKIPERTQNLRWKPVAGASWYYVLINDATTGRIVGLRMRAVANYGKLHYPDGRYKVRIYARTSSWRLVQNTILRTGAAATTPPTLAAPASIKGRNDRSIWFRVRGVDPYGGPVKLTAKGLPSGMRFYARWGLVYGYRVASGNYLIKLTATNEVGVKTSKNVKLKVTGPKRTRVRLSWSKQSGDKYYYVLVYNYTTRRYAFYGLVSRNSKMLELDDGKHLVWVYRRQSVSFTRYGRTYSRTYWRFVGSKRFNVPDERSVRID